MKIFTSNFEESSTDPSKDKLYNFDEKEEIGFRKNSVNPLSYTNYHWNSSMVYAFPFQHHIYNNFEAFKNMFSGNLLPFGVNPFQNYGGQSIANHGLEQMNFSSSYPETNKNNDQSIDSTRYSTLFPESMYNSNDGTSKSNSDSKVSQKIGNKLPQKSQSEISSQSTRDHKKNQEKIKRWNFTECKLYEDFIRKYNSIMSDSTSKRMTKIFIFMSKFIQTKSPSQCRSHHQKFYPKILKELEIKGISSFQLPNDEFSESLKLAVSENSNCNEKKLSESYSINSFQNNTDFKKFKKNQKSQFDQVNPKLEFTRGCNFQDNHLNIQPKISIVPNDNKKIKKCSSTNAISISQNSNNHSSKKSSSKRRNKKNQNFKADLNFQRRRNICENYDEDDEEHINLDFLKEESEYGSLNESETEE